MKFIDDLGKKEKDEIINRSSSVEEVMEDVREIVDTVRRQGDRALIDLTKKFDSIELNSLRVDQEKMREARRETKPEIKNALKESAKRIKNFHARQKREEEIREVEKGIKTGRFFFPLESAGAYVPGGRASYPSTALMTVIPAKVAGVERVIACTPPEPNSVTLCALDIAGADEVYKVGGGQAISAMAYGTESIKPVDIVVGPGNIYVAAAKRLIRDKVRIDFEAGPSEVGIISDTSADPRVLAGEMLAQTEHDPNSKAVLCITSETKARKVEQEIEKLLDCMERKETAKRARKDILVGTIEECIEFMSKYAPEHLLVIMEKDQREEKIAKEIANAGSIFLGNYTPVAAGDYATGTNHVLPTGGTARLRGGLSLEDFTKSVSVQRLSHDGLKKLEDTIRTLANTEGLDAHAKSINLRGGD